mmetsp:Transcript_22572/g.35530  ORF Transcript_22572/g.35530 Transcript_22572/m.35530 type:complete len:81 (+) Transcript_22572:152-394(+)
MDMPPPPRFFVETLSVLCVIPAFQKPNDPKGKKDQQKGTNGTAQHQKNHVGIIQQTGTPLVRDKQTRTHHAHGIEYRQKH